MNKADFRRLKQNDPDTCVDFSLVGTGHATDAYKIGWERIFGRLSETGRPSGQRNRPIDGTKAS